MRLAGKQQQAEELIDTVYDALYDCAKIPFAAPEGFNCSVVVQCSDLIEQFNLTKVDSESWLMILKESECILADGRVNPFLSESFADFKELIKSTNLNNISEAVIIHLYGWLQDTGLKYTAGRYFRPGMIFSYLPEALS